MQIKEVEQMDIQKNMYDYKSSIHNWDMTLEMAKQLICVGKISGEDKLDLGSKIDKFFEGTGLVNSGGLKSGMLTGGMIMSHCAVESFVTSAADMLTGYEGFPDFRDERFKKERAFWDRLKMVYKHVNIEVNKNKEPFKGLFQLHMWRLAVVHSKPIYVAAKNVDPGDRGFFDELHNSHEERDYLRDVNDKNASDYYQAASDVIRIFIDETGLRPTTGAVYSPK